MKKYQPFCSDKNWASQSSLKQNFFFERGILTNSTWAWRKICNFCLIESTTNPKFTRNKNSTSLNPQNMYVLKNLKQSAWKFCHSSPRQSNEMQRNKATYSDSQAAVLAPDVVAAAVPAALQMSSPCSVLIAFLPSFPLVRRPFVFLLLCFFQPPVSFFPSVFFSPIKLSDLPFS